MYGIINKSIENLVKEKFGEEQWALVKKRSGVDIDFFISNEPYDDRITYQLASAISAELDIPLDQVLETFGEWWVLKTSKEKYGGLMEAGGNSLMEFLVNLPLFHNRVMLIYPKLTPPEFLVSHIEERSIHVHYLSARQGLQPFVKGLFIGLGKMYDTAVQVELLQSRENGDEHEIFKLSW